MSGTAPEGIETKERWKITSVERRLERKVEGTESSVLQ